ncbi:hypothetical protein EJK15_63765 [Nonomuraea basaltis]|nr:hypothetical protein EJK15_63765 [Nonomuraea basaltis]
MPSAPAFEPAAVQRASRRARGSRGWSTPWPTTSSGCGRSIVFDVRRDVPPAAERTAVTTATTPSGRSVTLLHA